MARDSSVSDDDRYVGGETQPASDGDSDSGLIDRRSYMKIGAATAAAAALTTGVSASSDDYDVIEARGQVIRLDDETFENKLIDVTSGNDISIIVDGTATVRNVGVHGLYRGDGFIFTVTASHGTVEFENVYVGDGANKSGSSFTHGPGGFFYHARANADVVFRECNVQGYPNNGWYCSNSAGSGSVTWERCYGKNNGVSTFRAANQGDTLRDCVAYNDDTDYSTENGNWGGYTEDTGRPLWVWPPGGITVENCQFDAGSYGSAVVTHNGSSVSLDGGAVSGGAQGSVNLSSAGDDPDLSVPEGVPTSAEEAATGEGASASSGADSEDSEDEEQSHVLLFDGDAADVTRYEFVVDGDVEPSNDEGASIDAATEIDDDTVHGVVADWRDAFRFDGDLENLTVDGPATVLLDGEEIDPDEVGAELPHVLEVEGQGEPTSFELTVDGTIELADDEDESTAISGSTVQSSVTDETLPFQFSGALTDVTIIDGDAAVRLDDEEIDPDEYGETELLPHAIVFDGTETDEPSSYAFETSGAVHKSTYQDATISSDDVIEGQTVRGVVDDWLDAYWFDGDLEEFTLNGDADVDIQYNARDQ